VNQRLGKLVSLNGYEGHQAPKYKKWFKAISLSTMLDEYKTPDRFWAEAINTACYSINRLYLHRIFKKTSYELLTGKKPNVSYFRVFGSKYFILIKRGRNSKFAPKVVEGFYLVMTQTQGHIESSTNPLD
jgi:hypothetical protein